MSARFFKIFLGVLLAHLVVFSVVWVGFSAPYPKPPATFIYEGELPVEDTGGSSQEDVWQKGNAGDQFTIDHPVAAYSDHWAGLRELSKSSAYDHLGF